MESFFTDFTNAINKPEVTTQELEILTHEYSQTYYSRRLPHEEAVALLEKKAPSLRSIELWMELLSTKTDMSNCEKFELLEKSILDIGFDPRSGTLWATFLKYFVELRNFYINNKQLFEINHSQIFNVEQTNPIEQLVNIEEESLEYSKRHKLNDHDTESLYTFNSAYIDKTIEETMILVNPLDYLVSNSSSLNISELEFKHLRKLYKNGRLSVFEFKNYLTFLCVNVIKDVSNIYQTICEIDPKLAATLEYTNQLVQKKTQNIEKSYPILVFTQPSSALVPEIDEISVTPWCEILQLEVEDHLAIRNQWPLIYKNRLEFFFFIAMRQCGNVPHIYFINAQMLFSRGLVKEGIRQLRDMTQHMVLSNNPNLYIILANAEQYLNSNPFNAEKLLAIQITTHMNKVNERYKIDSVIFNLLLLKLKYYELAHFYEFLISLLNEEAISNQITIQLANAILYLLSHIKYSNESNIYGTNKEFSNENKYIFSKLYYLYPDSCDIACAYFSSNLPKSLNYISILGTMQDQSNISNDLLSNIKALAGKQAYYGSSSSQTIYKVLGIDEDKYKLITPNNESGFEDYYNFVTSFPSLFVTVFTPTSSVVPVEIRLKELIGVSKNLLTIVSIANMLSSYVTNKNKTKNVINTMYNAAKDIVSEDNLKKFEALLSDQVTINTIDRWINYIDQYNIG